MPDNQFAVGYMKPVVDVFKLVWNHQHTAARYEQSTRAVTLGKGNLKQRHLVTSASSSGRCGAMVTPVCALKTL